MSLLFSNDWVFRILPLLVLSRAKAKSVLISEKNWLPVKMFSSSCISKSLLNLGRCELVLLLDDEIF